MNIFNQNVCYAGGRIEGSYKEVLQCDYLYKVAVVGQTCIPAKQTATCESSRNMLALWPYLYAGHEFSA